VEKILLFDEFFPLLIRALVAKIQPDKVVQWRADGEFLHHVVQHISDMHSKFALRPHHVWKYGRHPICDAENMRGKKEVEEERGKKPQLRNIMVCPIAQP